MRARLPDVEGYAERDGVKLAYEVHGAVVYLHTPDGFGRSVLADLLARKASPTAAGTARNWSTVSRLLAMCQERAG